jgi:hypothetical protein
MRKRVAWKIAMRTLEYWDIEDGVQMTVWRGNPTYKYSSLTTAIRILRRTWDGRTVVLFGGTVGTRPIEEMIVHACPHGQFTLASPCPECIPVPTARDRKT